DCALFYPGYLSMEEKSAWKLCNTLLKNAVTYGGVLTILWHTRSLAPERLWGDFYARLLQELRARRVWFATAGQVVDWFRTRRALSFRSVEFSQGRLRLVVEHKGCTDVSDRPCPIIRIHIPPPELNAAGPHQTTSP